MTTALSVTATPGAVHTFAPKAGEGAKPSDRITALSVTATPGGLQTFLAKTPPGDLPADQVTDLSVMATPGAIHVFLPKDEAVTPPAAKTGGVFRSKSTPTIDDFLEQQIREDEELLSIAVAAMRLLQ